MPLSEKHHKKKHVAKKMNPLFGKGTGVGATSPYMTRSSKNYKNRRNGEDTFN